MSTFGRYLAGRLLMHFGFFSLVLVAVYWVNRAIGLFDRLLAGGSNLLIFLEFTALALPNVVALVLPVAALVATIYAVNRMAGDGELVVAQTAGIGPWRLLRPVLLFGAIVGLMVALLAHVLVPASRIALAERGREVSDDVTARLLREGEFLHPGRGVTAYLREITPDGALLGLFLQDRRDAGLRTTYTAERAYLYPAENGGGPRLVMVDGMAQTLDVATRSLVVTTFDDFAYDLGRLAGMRDARHPDPRELPTPVLLDGDPEVVALTGAARSELRYEGHARSAGAIRAALMPAMALGFLLLGGYSRLGLWRQIAAAVLAAVVLELTANIVETEASADEAQLWTTYLPPLAAAALAAALLWRDTLGPSLERRLLRAGRPA